MNCFAVILLASLIAFVSASGRVPSFRIINGTDAKPGQFPHQVSLRASGKNRHFCGGSIIAARWILTAAHCSFLPNGITPIAVVGTDKLNEGGIAYSIDRIIPHPKYRHTESMKFDIALWYTSENIVFNKYVQPIALPSRDTTGDVPLIVSGWGLTSDLPPTGPGNLPNQLQYMKTKSLSVSSCMRALSAEFQWIMTNNLEQLVCVYAPNASASKGDSGGALISLDGVVVGVCSWGVPKISIYPNGFTRVYSFLDFITATMNAHK